MITVIRITKLQTNKKTKSFDLFQTLVAVSSECNQSLDLSGLVKCMSRRRGKEREGKGREGKGREGKEGKGREGRSLSNDDDDTEDDA